MRALRRIAHNPFLAAACLEAWEVRRGALARGETPPEDEQAVMGGWLTAASLGAAINFDDD